MVGIVIEEKVSVWLVDVLFEQLMRAWKTLRRLRTRRVVEFAGRRSSKQRERSAFEAATCENS